MDLMHLIQSLSDVSAYPYAVDRVEVRQTHISVVFLAGEFVYKVKKPVDLGFLDFTTLEKRRFFCDEEVRLNRRLAPEVYRGVVPVTQIGSRLQFEGTGEIVEWAVKMQRLPEEATLLRRLQQGKVGSAVVEELANRLAAFHAQAGANERIATFGTLQVVACNARENFEQAKAHVGVTVSARVFERVRLLTEASLERLGPLIDARAERGVPRDTHGDLHLDHVYLFPDRSPPADLVVIDCIEFNERFRFADPVADLAFLYMDFAFQGCRDLAQNLARAYFQAAHDPEGLALLPFYSAYRSAIRAKVEGLKSLESEVPMSDQKRALAKARAHWLLALAELEPPERKPCMVLVGGLPGSGKSTLARSLGEQADFKVLRSDVIRKELAKIRDHDSPAGPEFYTPEWNDRTYAACLKRAEGILFEGGRVLIDASFIEESRRRAFLEVAADWRVPVVFFVCQTDSEHARQRIQARRGDASDADWSVYLLASERWEEFGPQTRLVAHEVSNNGDPSDALANARQHLEKLGLFE